MRWLNLQPLAHCQKLKTDKEICLKRSNVHHLISKASTLLSKANICCPVFEAELFLSYVLHIQRHVLYIDLPFVPKSKEKQFFNLVLKRCQHIPVSYILGNVYFYESLFYIKPGVFIPRPETELIIESVCWLFQDKTLPLKILDIGTGSGVLAISLAKIFPRSTLIATDISKKAINTAKKNIALHHLQQRICIFRADIIPDISKTFDIIVTNPPYLTEEEIKDLPEEVKKEPLCAVYGGKTGIDVIKKIMERAVLILNPAGFIIMEISPSNLHFFKHIDAYGFKICDIRKDINGIERIVILKRI